MSSDRISESERLFAEALEIIPGGVTSARHPSKFVRGHYPIFLNHGKGSHVWDVDGNEYIDWLCSFGPNVLGHVHPRVEKAVRENLEQGFCFTMPSPLQNVLAAKLREIIPCAEMVRFLTSGSDATAAAIRIARVHTGRDKVVRWGYHGWHDWSYGGAGTDRASVGVPASACSDVLAFSYNDLDSLDVVLDQNKGQVAALIMQPYDASYALPEEGFLEGVKQLCHAHDVVFIYDEIRTGFRMALGGAQEYFGVAPDMACFSKAMANGYPISTVVGSREVMQCADQTRLSATFFVNAFPMVAALATIAEIQETNGIAHMWRQGNKLIKGMEEIAAEMGVDAEMVGLAPLPMLKFTGPDADTNAALKEAFFGQCADRGVILHPGHNWFLSLAHTDEDVQTTLDVARCSMKAAAEKVGRR